MAVAAATPAWREAARRSCGGVEGPQRPAPRLGSPSASSSSAMLARESLRAVDARAGTASSAPKGSGPAGSSASAARDRLEADWRSVAASSVPRRELGGAMSGSIDAWCRRATAQRAGREAGGPLPWGGQLRRVHARRPHRRA